MCWLLYLKLIKATICQINPKGNMFSCSKMVQTVHQKWVSRIIK